MPTSCGHATKRHVSLTEDDRRQLQVLLKKGTHSTRVLTRARILLAADQSDTDARYVAGGLDRARYDAPRPGGARKLDGCGLQKIIRAH